MFVDESFRRARNSYGERPVLTMSGVPTPKSHYGDPCGYLHLKEVIDLTSGEKFATRIRRLASALSGSGSRVARVFDVEGNTEGVQLLEDVVE
ncbi:MULTISPECIES: hypothetical protein [unclassified Paenarthrobacter]|uniref:hypothetical protein n=1 Tax=unclassified Paenarthrobacter TaxID=2634190 RepID=UPI000A7A9249